MIIILGGGGGFYKKKKKYKKRVREKGRGFIKLTVNNSTAVNPPISLQYDITIKIPVRTI